MADASLNQWRRQKALALSVVFGVLVVSCDERALPTQPTSRQSFVPQGPQAPLTPTPTPTPTPTTRTPPLTVSLRVLGFRAPGEWVPVPNLRLKVASGDHALLATPLADVVTDAHGRFTINDNSAFILFFQTDPGSEYRFLCDWYPINVNGPLTDLPVVHRTWSGNRKPHGYVGNEGAFGTVSEQIDGSLQPVADATVTFDGIEEPPATTNPNGFYMICSVVGGGQLRTIAAFKTGYDPVTREVDGNGGEVHFQLTRK